MMAYGSQTLGCEQMKMNPLGAALGPEVNRQVPPIAIALEELEKEIHGLREVMSVLENRLSPAMRPIPAADRAAPNGRLGGSPLVSQIETLIQLVRNVGADVYMIVECLEM
jgi:hypothetical protein